MDEDFEEPTEEASEAKKITFPETVGECVDKLYALRAQRLTLEKEVKERKSTEAAYVTHIIDRLKESKLDGVQGSNATFSYSMKDIPQPQDWNKIWAWAKEHDAFDLFQKRLSGEAVQSRWDDGVTIDGVGVFSKAAFSLTKRGTKK